MQTVLYNWSSMGTENGLFTNALGRLEVAAKMKVAERVTSFERTQNIRIADELAIRNKGVILAYANHTQHLNIQGFARIADVLKGSVNNFYIPTAWTLTHGGQKEEITKFANHLEPLMKRRKIHFLPVARWDDLKKIDKPQRRDVISKSAENKNRLMDVIENGTGAIFAFPEGTTEGGIELEEGKFVGIKEPNNNLMSECVNAAIESGRELVFLPVGMVDFHKIVKPRTEHAEPEVAVEFKNSLIPWKKHQKLAKVIYGEPFLLSEAMQDDSNVPFLDNVNRYLLNEVAGLLPEEIRGEFR